jgi:acetylornithine deacetylase/succinyl-diaminopimelate desuccinylase-like protein
VPDEEDGMADVGMRWLLEARPDIRPDVSINEGGGEVFELTDGRRLASVGVGEKGTYPARVTALGQAGHGSTPTIGDNAVPHLGRLLARVGAGLPAPVRHPLVDAMLRVLLGPSYDAGCDLPAALAAAGALHPELEHYLPALAGTTMAPTMVGGSDKRNVMPSRAWVELDCRILPGTTEADVEAAVRARIGDGIAYDLSWPEPLIAGSASPPDGPVVDAIRSFLVAEGVQGEVLPSLGTGFTDSVYLRAAAGTAAYGYSPFLTTPLDVLLAGYHNADERVHVDDLHASVRFHLHLARELLS